jgi:hypothetical protein
MGADKMKEFFVGLVFLVFVGVFAMLGALVYPLFLLIAFVLRLLLSAAILIFFVWLLGKFILFLSRK